MAITDRIPVPGDINPGLQAARQITMLGLLGNPRMSYGDDCRDVTNPALKRLVVHGDVGPFKVRGLMPAVEALAAIMAEIAVHEPEVHAALGSAGMLCCRFVHGSVRSISNHSWGTAIDLTLDGTLDRRGDGMVQRGLAAIAPIFNRHGWYWGAGFGAEDGMHFEASDGLIREWHANGLFGPGGAVRPAALALGDRGREVRRLQAALNAVALREGTAAGTPLAALVRAPLVVDGDFGPATCAALVAFQAGRGLPPIGIADTATLAALDIGDAPDAAEEAPVGGTGRRSAALAARGAARTIHGQEGIDRAWLHGHRRAAHALGPWRLSA